MTECPRCGRPDSGDIHVCIPMELSRREAYLRGFADGAESMTHWIKCSNRMPETDDLVLGWFVGLYGMPVIVYYNGNEFLSQKKGDEPCTKWITHWMPLSSPPADK